jgi:hypothetical protein
LASMREGAESAESALQSAELAQSRARERALGLASVLRHTAHTLDRSADLAEEHAQRYERNGKHMAAQQERQAADRARMAAEQARQHAEQWQSANPGSG